MKRWMVSVQFAAFALVLAACGEHGLEDIEAEACEHLDEGPFQPLAATATAADAPAGNETHVSYEVSLVDLGEGSFGGFVAFDPPEAGEYYVFTDQPVELSFADASGATIAIESQCTSSPCSETCGIVERRYQLDVGTERVVVAFAPGAVTETLLLFEAGEHADH
jgi:hypothetical protein